MKCLPVLLLFSAVSSGQPLKIGEPAPPLTLEQTIPQGVQVDWNTLRGKPVVIEFWATWCEPCVEQIPHLNELAAKYPAVQFISVTDEAIAKVEPFLAKRSIQGWIGLDRGRETLQAYGIEGVPETVFIDAGGRLRGIMSPRQVTEVVLDDLIAGRPIQPKGPSHTTRMFEGQAPQPVYAMVLRPSGKSKPGGNFGINQGMLDGENIALSVIISYAWSVDSSRLIGPEEALRTRWDFCVELPAGDENEHALPHALFEGMTSERAMLRELIERSFKLKIRREAREMDAVVLKPGHARLQETRDGNETMRGLANRLASELKLPAVDETGFTARYQIDYPADHQPLDAFVREQLGLELTHEKRSIEFLVVDSLQLPQYSATLAGK
ncbi:MAG TPA: DUF3738 domain-containing protein [Verrucomicrobiae bacterium]|nr:DUF3738 domain-containing protein [Verrucomicrobiae bacterium]